MMNYDELILENTKLNNSIISNPKDKAENDKKLEMTNQKSTILGGINYI